MRLNKIERHLFQPYSMSLSKKKNQQQNLIYRVNILHRICHNNTLLGCDYLHYSVLGPIHGYLFINII